MSLQIANASVIAKVERIARATGLSKTAVVDRALDRLEDDWQRSHTSDRLAALLAQMDAIPDQDGAHDPLAWDANGLPV